MAALMLAPSRDLCSAAAMNVALLADTAWLDDELHSFQHLVVGLIDERVRVIQVMPDDVPIEASSVFAERVVWSESRWREVNRWRLGRLDDPLEKAEAHLLHALDSRLWRGAARLSEQMNVPVIFGASSADAVDAAERVVRDADPARVAFAASTEPIAQALRGKLDGAIVVETVPTGVHVAETTEGCSSEDALCVIVSGDGILDANYQALLNALVDVCDQHPGMQFFFDGQGSDQHQVWKAASRLGLLRNVSMIPRRLGQRDVLLRADVLIQPQPLGQSRSITLEAMAHGLAVIAHEDGWLDYLIDDQTAWLVRDTSAAAWGAAINRILADLPAARSLGQRARAWVREHRSVSVQLARTLDLYRRVTGQTLPFPGGA
jgi:glycosyltransferase involved in cell wall biosynthesis